MPGRAACLCFSSAVYGDEKRLAQDRSAPAPLSRTPPPGDERIYADVFARCYGMETIGLRYFNVCRPAQDPDGAYAA